MTDNIQSFADTPQGGGVSPELSRKITVLSFLAMIGVIYIHHNAVEDGAATWNAVAQGFLTRGLTDWAVPFFFVVSGFWFARGAYVQGRQGFAQLWAKKARTLLVPYLLWAVIGAAIVLPVIVFNNHVTQRPLLSRSVLGHDSLWGFVDALVGVAGNGPQGNLALWYVRTLLIFFLLAPAWRVLVRCGKGVLLGLGLVLALGLPEAWIPHTGLKFGSFGWLLLGMGAADWMAADRRLPRGAAIACGVAWAGLALAKAMGVSCGLERLIPLAGILFFWSVADWANLCCDFMKPTFWVYCLHGALAAYFLSGPLFVFGKSDVSTFLIMLLMPWANLAFCLVAAHAARRFAPRVYALLTGGRG